MPQKPKTSKSSGYKLIVLCVAALILGSLIPLLALNQHDHSSQLALVISEIAGAAALLYVFTVYLLKK